MCAALLVAQAASAQGYVSSISSEPWVDIASIPGIGTVNTQSLSGADDGDTAVSLPFTFDFLGSPFTSANVGSNGYLVFGARATSLGNVAIGLTTAPDNFIAAFWDDLIHPTAANVRVATYGTAPSRVVVIQAGPCSRFGSSGGTFSYQFRLYESSGRFDYRTTGNLVGSASGTSGWEGNGGTPNFTFLPCSPNCTTADASAMSGNVYSAQAGLELELVALGVTAPEFGYVNTPLELRATVANGHFRALGPFTVSVDLSRSPRMTNPTRIYTSGNLTFPAFVQRELTLTATPPVGLSEGEYYVQLIVDSGNAILEPNEANNSILSPTRVRILQGRPDFSVDRVWLDEYALTAGQPVQVYARISNRGSDRASAAAAVILSSNPAITAQDDRLVPFTIDLAAGETLTTTQTVTLASRTNSGTYYVGVLADSGQTVDELSESNNGLAAFTPITVSGGGLAITTRRLPEARLGTAYTGLLAATGGSGPYRWAITSGRLPANLGLVASTGEIFGRVVAVGETRFTVQVTSDGETASQDLVLVVSNPQAPLTVVSRAVGVGTVGQEYAFELIATGGVATATRTWSGTGLPDGLRVTPEGLLTGLPTAAATTTIAVSVTDGTTTATRDLVVRVFEDGRLLIDTTPLPNARYQEAYSATLTAKGGIPPLTWTIDSGALPPGLSLSTGGVIGGTASAVGTFRVVIRARDSATRGLSAADLNTFELTVEQTGSFTITTTTLPVAYAAEAFDQSIAATGGVSPLTWRIVAGRLPNGIDGEVSSDTASFRVVGSPPDTGVANFLLEVTDAAGRTALQPFAIQVVTRPPPPVVPEKSGCSTTGAPGSGAALALVAAGLLASRRRRR